MEEISHRLAAGTLAAYLAEVLDVHGAWFPGSALATLAPGCPPGLLAGRVTAIAAAHVSTAE